MPLRTIVNFIGCSIHRFTGAKAFTSLVCVEQFKGPLSCSTFCLSSVQVLLQGTL